MNNRKVAKSTKRRLIIIGPISIVIIVYFFINIFDYGFNIVKLYNQEESLKKSLIVLKEEEVDLKIELQKLKDPEYIARYARENYLYSKDGEYIIKIDKNKEEKVEDPLTSGYDYTYLIPIALVVIIYIWAHKKKKKELVNN